MNDMDCGSNIKSEQKPIIDVLIDKLNSKINNAEDLLYTIQDTITVTNSKIQSMSDLEGIIKCANKISLNKDSEKPICKLNILSLSIDRVDNIISELENIIERTSRVNTNLNQLS